MLTARFQNGNIISAFDYNPEIHSRQLYCVDHQCKAPLIFVEESENGRSSHFKTSGKGESRHTNSCGFYQPLDLVESIQKVRQFHDNGIPGGLKEIIIRLSMNRIDPDKQTKTVEREVNNKKEENLKVKNDSLTPQSISSVKGAMKLLTEYEPDILSSILINVGSGRKIPLSSLMLNQEQAHTQLWNDELFKDVGYFVYGKVTRLIKREKVMYINFEEQSVPFTIVIFLKHWQDFSYTEKQLASKDVLVYGHLRKNQFQDKNLTEIIIKSDSYLEVFKRKQRKEGSSKDGLDGNA